MKKVIVLLSLLSLFLITGCTNLKTLSIDKIIETVIKKDSKLKNVNFEGYSYYVPRGLKFLNKNEYNAYLSDSYNNHYYIYVDVVSKHNNIKHKYKVDKDAYYSKAIKSKKKFGYLEIKEYKDNYFIEAMYNYMKIEAYVEKDSLNDALTDIGMVLSSVKYNNKVLDTIVGENILNYKEESYNIFETKKDKGDFLDYVKEYDSEETTKDEDSIEIEEEE